MLFPFSQLFLFFLPIDCSSLLFNCNVTCKREINIPNHCCDVRAQHSKIWRYQPEVNELSRHPNLPVHYNSIEPVLFQFRRNGHHLSLQYHKSGQKHSTKCRRKQQLVNCHGPQHGPGARCAEKLGQCCVPVVESGANKEQPEACKNTESFEVKRSVPLKETLAECVADPI